MNTFNPPIPPSPGSSNKPEIKILLAEFGDGYTQESPDGLNNVRDVLTLTWDYLKPDTATSILNFMRAQKGCIAFYYTPSNWYTADPNQLKWTCRDFSSSYKQNGLQSVTVTLRRSFNLDS